jgi:hypothetical protein
MPVQSPFAAGRNQLVAGQRLQDRPIKIPGIRCKPERL